MLSARLRAGKRITGAAAAIGLALLSRGCGSPGVAPAAPPSQARAAVPAGSLVYRVTAGEGAEELRVEATFPSGVPAELSVDDDAEPFLRDLEIDRGGVWHPIPARGTSWFAPACAAAGCTLRYRYDLGGAARAIGDPGVAGAHGPALLAPPSTWLLHPLRMPSGVGYRFEVSTPPGLAFVTGVTPALDGAAGAYAADVSDLPQAPFSAYGPMRIRPVPVPGGVITLALLPGEVDLSPDVVEAWVTSAARAVAAYFGAFPVERALVMVQPTRGAGFGYARTLGNGGASILAPLGRSTTAEDLRRDWVMTHEMLHLGFPNLPRRHSWLEEGMATYVEPLARARAGALAVEEVWRGMIRGLPQGLGRAGDDGLDGSPSWGKTYWGGALFCLLADLEIRERTGGARSLDDALRGILRAGGDVRNRWSLEQTLAAGDRATGVSVLRELHARMGSAPIEVDLPALWTRLGVELRGREIRFDDAASLAATRRALTTPPR